MKKTSLLLIPAALILLAGCQAQNQSQVTVTVNDDPSDAVVSSTIVSAPTTSTVKTTSSATSSSPQKITAVIPASLELPVAFASQAPFGNWDKIHEETCEEASMINVAKYYAKQPLNDTIMEQELQKLLQWETDRGYKVDLTADETATILQQYFGLKATVSSDVTVNKVKYELSKNNLIILPTAGQELGNPNFTGSGPIYHMLVVKGYNSKNFITNDVGTKNGNSYVYAYNTLLNAVHDWQPSLVDKMTPMLMDGGQKVMIIVSK